MDLERAFLKAYDDNSDAIFRHCAFRVWDRELAADLTQETFIRTWEYLKEGKRVDNLRAFLFRVANNLVIDWSRKKKAVSLEAVLEGGLEVGFDGRSQAESALDLKLALSALSELEEPYRTAVQLRYVEDLSPQEISRILNESENVISVRIHRGVKILRTRYADGRFGKFVKTA